MIVRRCMPGTNSPSARADRARHRDIVTSTRDTCTHPASAGFLGPRSLGPSPHQFGQFILRGSSLFFTLF